MLSLPHLVVLFVIALVIFGPQKLPELARMLGKATAEFRKMTGDFRTALEEEVREMERQTRIREAEAAAASTRGQLPAAQPEGTTPRSDVPLDMPHEWNFDKPSNTEVPQPPSSDPSPAEHTAEAVSTHPEKSPNDNPAV